MSYTFIAASARDRRLDAHWEDVTIDGLTLGQIFERYQGIYLELSHYAFPYTVFLNLYEMRETFTVDQLGLTVLEWLVENGNNTLNTAQTLPEAREVWVKYNDAFASGYNVELVAIGRSADSQIHSSDKNDLLLTKSSVNFSQMWQYFLVSVNGFFHRSVLGPNGLYVIEGGRTRRLSNQNIAGIMSFREVAKTRQLALKPDMIHPIKAGRPLNEGVLVTLPEDINGKTILLVIGGFLHVLDSSYHVVGDRSIKINMSNFNLADRFFHSMGKINLSSIPVEQSPVSPRKTSVSSLFSDPVIMAYLTLPQSFMIVVETDDIYLRRHRLDNTQLPGVYQQEGPFKRLPMFGTYGAILDYVAYKEYQKYVYNANFVHEPNLNYRTTEWRFENAIDDTKYSSNPWRLGDGTLMEFGKFI